MKKIEKILESITAVILLVMLICCLLQVLFRFVLHIPAPFTEEFARMGYIWMVFLTLPLLEAKNEQLKVTFFFDKIPMAIRAVLYWVISVAYVVLLVFTAYGAVRYYESASTLTFASVRWLLMSYQYIPVMIGCVLGILFIIRRAIHFKEAFAQEEAEYEVGGSGKIIAFFVGLLLILFLMGRCPVPYALIATSVVGMIYSGGFGPVQMGTMAQKMTAGVNSFTLLAIPFFLLAGKMMNVGSITKRIFNFCNALVGWIPGGLGQVNILASVVFAGMSGSAVADAARPLVPLRSRP